MNLGLTNLSNPVDLLGDQGQPEPIIEETPSLESIEIRLDPSTADLVSVEDLDVTPLEEDVTSEPSSEVAPSVESFSPIVPQVSESRPTAKENIAIHRLYTAVGLEFMGELPKPPPAIFVDEVNNTVRAFLNGVCYTTVSPLIHLLINAGKDVTFVIEINSPMLRLEDIISVVSALENTAAETRTIITASCRIPALILGISGTDFELLPSVHIFAPLTSFAVGSGDEIEGSGEYFSKYSNYMINYLVDRKVLTKDEAAALQEESTIFTLTSEEIKSRMGVVQNLSPIPGGDPTPIPEGGRPEEGDEHDD